MSHHLFTFFFILLSLHRSSALTAASDVAVLRALHLAIAPSSIPATSCLASWNFTSDPCRPSSPSHFICGITCNSAFSFVTVISLDPIGYSAILPASLRSLSFLSHLHIPHNSFRSPLPVLPKSLLSIDISSNGFHETIPYHIGTLSNLVSLDISFNSFSGSIPLTFSSLKDLTVLDLSSNLVSGHLPASLPPNLITFTARQNYISGSLTRSTFEPLRRLEVLELAANRFSGKLYSWLFTLPSLQQLDLGNNSFTEVEVSGTADRLVALDLGYNMINGELPKQLAGFPSLAAVSLRHNKLRGVIPREYMKAKKGVGFRRLFLDGNFLKGKVPLELLQQGELRGSVGDNCLEGCNMKTEMCSPEQKKAVVCRQVYGTAYV